MPRGYVYVLTNPALRGQVKIGKTANRPEERAAALSTTGLPHDFELVYSVYVSDCDLVERRLHEELASVRVSPKREFFRVETTEAINLILEIAQPFRLSDQEPRQVGLNVVPEARQTSLPLSDHCELLILGGTQTAALILAPVTQGGRAGFIDRSGKFVIEPAFRDVGTFSEGLATASPCGEGWTGYIDKTGKWTVEPRFCEAHEFSEGCALVTIYNEEQDECEWGYLRLDTLRYAREGWCEDSLWRALQLMKERKTRESPLSEGLRASSERSDEGYEDAIGWLWGYRDATDHWVIEPQFTYTSTFSGGLAPVCVGEQWGVIDRVLNWVVPPQYDNIQPFSEGVAEVRINGKSGFIDRAGTSVITPQFETCRWGFDEGLACVGVGDRYGLINAAGRFVVPPKFKQIGRFHHELAYVEDENGKWGFIDKQGRTAIKLQFEHAGSFHSTE